MDKKGKIKAGLTFGIAMAVFFILKDLLTYDELTIKNIVKILVSGLFASAVSGLLFGWIIGKLANSKVLTKGTKIETKEGETVLFETGANHFKGVEAVGGKLYLTNQRLVFKSHKLNIQNHELSIVLSAINKIERYRTLGVTNNGISVTNIDNKMERFVVQQPEAWFERLQKKNDLRESIQLQ